MYKVALNTFYDAASIMSIEFDKYKVIIYTSEGKGGLRFERKQKEYR